MFQSLSLKEKEKWVSEKKKKKKKERNSLKNRGGESRQLASYILATKKINLDVNKFYLIREVLFKCF